MWRYVSILLLTLSLIGGGFSLALKIELAKEQEKRITAEARLALLHLQGVEQATRGAELAIMLQSDMKDLQARLAAARAQALHNPAATRQERKDMLVALIRGLEHGREVEQSISR